MVSMPRLFFFLLLVTALLTPLSEVNAECTTACTSSEIVDAKGCCIARPSPLEISPASAPHHEQVASLPWVPTIQAYHSSTTISSSPDRPIQIDAQTTADVTALDVSRHDTLATRLWNAILALEAEMIPLARRCADEESPEEVTMCTGAFDALKRRRDHLVTHAHMIFEALLVRDASGLWRDQTRYRLAILRQWTGDTQGALQLLAPLAEAAEKSPYSSVALATLGDLLYSDASWMHAQSLYLRSRLLPGEAIAPYTYLGQGWTHARLQQWGEAMEALGRGLRLLRETRHIVQNGPLLEEEMLDAMAVFYAHVGDPAQAHVFWERLSLPSWRTEIMLTRLASYYEELDKRDDALILYERLAEDRLEARQKARALRRMKRGK